MTNYEKMNEQISDVSELFKGMFTKEELDDMKKRYEEMVEEQTRLQLQKMQESVKITEENK